MRYVLDLPRSWDEKLVARAADEDVPPRVLLYFLLSKGITRADAVEVKRRIERRKQQQQIVRDGDKFQVA